MEHSISKVGPGEKKLTVVRLKILKGLEKLTSAFKEQQG